MSALKSEKQFDVVVTFKEGKIRKNSTQQGPDQISSPLFAKAHTKKGVMCAPPER